MASLQTLFCNLWHSIVEAFGRVWLSPFSRPSHPSQVAYRARIGSLPRGAMHMDSNLREALLDVLKGWATQVIGSIGSDGVFLFGSLLYRDGEQFNEVSSDVDLLMLFPGAAVKNGDAATRLEWLEKSRNEKAALEAKLIAILARADSEVSMVSVVSPTELEIEADVHKDGADGFFSCNRFLDLGDGQVHIGLPNVGQRRLTERLLIQCLRFAQKKRNEFVNVTATGAGGLPPFDGPDPAPKDLMRHAAMAAALKEGVDDPGAEYDTQKGLDLLSAELYARRAAGPVYGNLQNTLSVRRGARGERRPLSPSEQMLLAEMVRDVACDAYRSKQAKGPKLPSLQGHDSTVEFANRFAQAFPGVRGIAWFKDRADIKRRLEILLREPLVYSEETPIWWFGDGNLHIERFEEVEPGIFLMNSDELNIRCIAAVSRHTYYQSFVYVECDPMTQIGLYPNSAKYAAEALSSGQYAGEEYAILDNGHLITRAEYDDGAAVVDGMPVDIRGRADLRARSLTPRNFVIAANRSPINNGAFDNPLKQHLRTVLADPAQIEALAADVLRLRKRPPGAVY